MYTVLRALLETLPHTRYCVWHCMHVRTSLLALSRLYVSLALIAQREKNECLVRAHLEDCRLVF